MSRSALCRICASLALAFVLLHPSLAAPRQTQVSSPQAAMLLQKSLAALVGNTSISDVTLTGTARRIAGSEDESGAITFKALSSGATRFDFSYPSGSRSEVRSSSNGQPVGSWSGPDGVSHPLAFHNLLSSDGTMPAFALSTFIKNQSFLAVLVGQETKNEQPVYHLSVSQQFPQLSGDAAALSAHLSQLDIFLDVSTLLPVALDFNTHPDDNALLAIPVEIQFSDYRSVSGVQVPFHVQKFLNNVLILDLGFQNAAINSGLSASTFSIQ